MIAKHGAFNREDIEQLWDQQVVIPPGMIIPEPQVDFVDDQDEEQSDEEEEEEDDEDDEQPQEDEAAVVDDRNQPPKKLSLFRASRLAGTLAKQ